jgi:hypothetical protein
VVGRTEAHQRGLSMVMSFGERGTTAVRADTESPMVRFGGGGLVDHGEAFRSSYMAGGGRRVAVNGGPFADREAVGNELTPGSLGDGLSSVRVLRAEDDEGVLLLGFDGDGRAGRWMVMVVLSVRMRVKQSSGGGAREKEKWRRVSSARPHANR